MNPAQTDKQGSHCYQLVMKCITLVRCSNASTGRSVANTCNASGESIRIIGYSTISDDIISVIVLEHEGTEYGVNGWSANVRDRGIYNEGSYTGDEGEDDEHEER